jgi:hypothetical protein
MQSFVIYPNGGWWQSTALPKIFEEIVSGVLVVFEFFHFV